VNSERLHTLLLLLCILVCCIATSADASERWALRVVSIEVDGRAEDKEIEIQIIVPGQERADKRTLSKGARIEQGAEIVVPPRKVLVFESANGNQIRLQPGSRFKVNVAGSEGETYTLLLGQALFKVSRALNFFNVNYQSFLAIVRGTEFDMAVEPEKEIRFRLIEGQLVVQREVKVKILEGDKVAELTASKILAQGKKTEVSYRLARVS
jgi:FecR protein